MARACWLACRTTSRCGCAGLRAVRAVRCCSTSVSIGPPKTHAVCVMDATGRIRAQFMIGHTAAGFAELLHRLGRLAGDPADVAVGIERPDGRLVDALLEAGYPVVPVSPNAIKTWRDAEVLSGAKIRRGRR